jgi:hypothetical protein
MHMFDVGRQNALRTRPTPSRCVNRADVWGRLLSSIIRDRRVLTYIHQQQKRVLFAPPISFITIIIIPTVKFSIPTSIHYIPITAP